MTMRESLDPQHLIGDVVRLGTIDSVDLAGATCRVRVGDLVTGDIAWLERRAGATRTWSPPSIGEQCVLICPDGDDLAGVALPGLFSDAHPAPGATTAELIRFADGAILSYDPQAQALAATLPAGGTVAIDAPGGVTITGPVTIKGKLTLQGDAEISGTATAQTDVVGGGKSLKGHKHPGVQPGGGVSGLPQ